MDNNGPSRLSRMNTALIGVVSVLITLVGILFKANLDFNTARMDELKNQISKLEERVFDVVKSKEGASVRVGDLERRLDLLEQQRQRKETR